MGDLLSAPNGSLVSLDVRVTGCADGRIALFEDGQQLQTAALPPNSAFSVDNHFSWTSDGQRHWFRADVTGPDGKLWLLGNPVYVNWK
jgi:hypothetical protein